jgi:MFS family permease
MEAATQEEDVLEWHRVDAAILGSLALGTVILFCGPVCGAIAFVTFKHNFAWELAFAIVGGVCVVVGPFYAFLRLARSLHEDASLAARTDGVIFERNGKSIHMKWDDIERVEFEPEVTLIFKRRSDEPFVLHERFATIETAELAKRLEDLRRKASFGLLEHT